MAIKTVKVEIDGFGYELTQLGAIEGRRVLTRLLRFVGPAVQVLASSEKLSEQSVAEAFSTAAKELDETTVAFLCETFGQKTRLHLGEHKAPRLEGAVFDDHFAGNYVAMLKWLGECLKLNFADFLSAIPAGNPLAGVLTQSK